MRSAATSLAALAALAPSIAIAAPPARHVPSRAFDFIPRLAFQGEGPLAPTVAFAVRGGAGREDAMLGRPSLRLYRAVPEITLSVRPAPGLEVFAGGGAGAAFVMGGRGFRMRVRETDLALSGSIGVRFSWQGVPLTAFARAESVVGQGAAVMLRLRVDFGAAR